MLYGGSKKFEYRRSNVRLTPGQKCFIYESAPISQVTGQFIVESVDRISLSEVRDLETSPALVGEVESYLENAKYSVAIKPTAVLKFSKGLSLSEFGLSRPPQSYQFVNPNECPDIPVR